MLQRRGAFLVRAAGDDHRQPEQIAERDRHRADAAGAAMDQHRVAVGREAALEQIDPHREQGLGHAPPPRSSAALRGTGRQVPAGATQYSA